ncbi:tetratricopeptide repeat protein [Candidatus Woesearchaeota archaeon]|nr:tetratricopeptide repeat protein [Candidatus Woesearchaeota archaeon]
MKEKEKEVFEKYRIKYMPTMLILTPGGKELGRFVGFYAPDRFIEILNECVSADDNLQEAKKILSGNAESAQGLYLRVLGNLYKEGKHKDAFADLDRLAKMKVTETNKKYVLDALWRLAGFSVKRLDSKIRAEEKKKHLQRLVELDKKNESSHVFEALYHLGISEMRNPEKMKEYFDKLRKLDSEDKSGFADNMAFAEAIAPYYSKEYKKAAANLENFVKKYADSEIAPKAYAQLAVCWYRAKEKDKTIDVLETLIKKFPDTKEAAAAKKWLTRLRK